MKPWTRKGSPQTVISMNDSSDRSPALLVATVTAFLTPFMGSAINIALPTIGKEFAMDAVLLSWVATSYLLAAAMFLVPFGRLADIYGRKRIFSYGMMIFAASSLFAALAPGALWLITARVIQGLGGAMIFGTGIAILTSVFPVGERGRVLGINVASVYLGLSLGPFLGGFMTQHLGWRSIFLLNVPLCLFVVAFMFRKLKGEWAEAKGENFDVAGSLIYSVTLPAMMYGFSLLPAWTGVWLVLFGISGLFAFIRWESRVRSPVFEMDLFRKNTLFAFSSLAAFVNYCATFSVGFLLSLYLQYTKGLDPQHAGMVLVSQPVVMTLFSPLAGRLSDRIEPRIVASAGMALTVVGLVQFSLLDGHASIPFIVSGLVTMGLGLALFSSPNANAIMSSVERKYYGVASAAVGTMRLTGQMLSMGIVMLVFAVYIGRAQITPEYYPLFLKSARIAFIIFAVLCFLGVLASLARGKVRE